MIPIFLFLLSILNSICVKSFFSGIFSGSGTGSGHTFIGETPTATATLGLGTPGGDVGGREIAHVGWVKKTIGTGGRAGRVFYETLVAASSISGDSEDLVTPDS